MKILVVIANFGTNQVDCIKKSIEENSSYTSKSLKNIFTSTRNFFLMLPFAYGFGIIFRLVDNFFGNPIKNLFDSIKIPGF